MSFLRTRHAKMLITIGPASNSKETLKELVIAGADAFRLNFSHGSHEDHAKVVKYIREIEQELNISLAILQDLQGPKIRLGTFDEAQVLKTGDTFILDNDKTPGDATRCYLPHPEILDVLTVGDKIYINDGLVRLTVKDTDEGRVLCDVIAGGPVSNRKGVNLPGVDLPISSITEKDWEDLAFGMKAGVDWVAVSFVQKPEDVIEVREKIAGRAAVIAKIEMPNAVDRIEAILAETDGIMVARGDLGIEVPLEEVPSIQKRLIRLCREAGKPVVVATQMLESMINSPMPTRAEVSDVANATFEGADALMLSAESAAGKYPVEAVETMSKVIERVESSSAWQPLIDVHHPAPTIQTADAITVAACGISDVIDAKAIVSFTESGFTACRASRQRPTQPILTVTPYEKVARKLALYWGLHCCLGDVPVNQDDMVRIATKAVLRSTVAQIDDQVVLTSGVPFGQSGTTNMIRVVKIED